MKEGDPMVVACPSVELDHTLWAHCSINNPRNGI
jgi:hypothetical protein